LAANDPNRKPAAVVILSPESESESDEKNMNSEKINSWLSLAANIGVVVGLLLLIVEINQNTEMMRSQMNQLRADSAMSQQHAYFNSEHLPAIMTKISNREELTPEENRRYRSYFRSFHRGQDNNLWQYNQGFLGENIPRSVEGAVRGIVGMNEFTLATWDAQKHGYTDEYVAFVEEAISDIRNELQ
jgi:hypothetical protein